MTTNKKKLEDFFLNLKSFHESTEDILNLFFNYINKRSIQTNFDYSYAAFYVVDLNIERVHNIKNDDVLNIIQENIKRKNEDKYFFSNKSKIYKIESIKSVFLFKKFNFESENLLVNNEASNFVGAGYIIDDNIALRNFLLFLREQELYDKFYSFAKTVF